MKIRAEIDGLRAVAVLPVIFFHAGFEYFGGGFIGVDVFFVISGYLITTILIEDIENERFSVLDFYERRARRLLPALFFVMFCCIPAAWLLMLPGQMKDFSQSLIAVSMFVSNILFWRESGYFDTAAEEKPLLHTWSLAVEEQYYVLFPIFLMLSWRFGKNRVFWMIIIMAVISLLLSEWGWRNKASANFYLAPTRAWELFSGSIAAFSIQKYGVRENNSLALLGLCAIILSIVLYDESTPFPSIYALMPVLGTVLLVLFAHEKTIAARLLRTKALVIVGLISYSAYLWHQPLLAFARIGSAGQPQNSVIFIFVISSLLLAYFSWKYIEAPFRDRTKFSRGKVFSFSIVGLVSFSLFGIAGYNTDGFQKRYKMLFEGDVGQTEYFQYIDEQYVDCEPGSVASKALEWGGVLRCKQSKIGEFDWLLLGDSHAEHLFIGLAEANPENNIAFYILGGKPYYGGQTFENIFDTVASIETPKTIFLSMSYQRRVKSSNELLDGFSSTISFLQNLGHNLILVGDVPRFDVSAENCKYGASIEQLQSFCSMSKDDFSKQLNIFDAPLKKLAEKYTVPYIPIHESLCSLDSCSMIKDGNLLYRDNNHLNVIGSRLVGGHLSSLITELD